MSSFPDTIILPVKGLGKNSDALRLISNLKEIDGLVDVTLDPGGKEMVIRRSDSNNGQDAILSAVREIRRAGLEIPVKRAELDIFNLRCAGCVKSLEDGLNKIPGIVQAQVNFATQTARVEYVGQLYDIKRLIGDIKRIGYEADFQHEEENRSKDAVRQGRRLSLILVCAGLIVLLHLTGSLLGWIKIGPVAMAVIQLLLTLPILYGGREIFIDAWHQLRHGRANMNSLVSLGAGTAFIYSLVVTYIIVGGGSGHQAVYFETTAMIIAFIMIGRYLEARATREARDAALAISSLLPQTVTRLKSDGSESLIELEKVTMGDILVVRPGGSVPCDGVVIEGQTVIDESLLTGESLPVDKKESDAVIGGTVNSGSPIKIRVTRTGKATVIARITRLVREAQSKKAPIQKLADKVAGIFVPLVILVAILTFVFWILFDPTSSFVLLAPVAVLLVACPCALGLATPTAVLVGTGRAARLGILIRDAEVLEKLTGADCFIFDKTGTLTVGRPEVEQVKPAAGLTSDYLLQMAAAVEKYSEHPFGLAILERAKTLELEIPEVKEFHYVPGKGVKAEVKGQDVIVGRRSFILESGLAEGEEKEIRPIEKEGGVTGVYVSVDGRFAGVIILGDTIKEGARSVIDFLREKGKHLIMLTGDNFYSAAAVASKLGLKHIEAEMTPDKKLSTIHSLGRAGYRTAMVGDGVNDAAALAAADIGMALGSGTDIAMKASDVTLAGKSLTGVTTAVQIADATMRIIKQNLFWAFIYNIAMIPLAAGLFYPLFNLTLSPVMAAAAMSLSSIFVVTNSLRLKKFEPVTAHKAE